MEGGEQLGELGRDRGAVRQPLRAWHVQQWPARKLDVGQATLLREGEPRCRNGQRRDLRDGGKQAGVVGDVCSPRSGIALFAEAHDQLAVDLERDVVHACPELNDRVHLVASYVFRRQRAHERGSFGRRRRGHP
jgi:hypothetical protein